MSDDLLNDSLAGEPHAPYTPDPLFPVTQYRNPDGKIYTYQHSDNDLLYFTVNLMNYSSTEWDTLRDFYMARYGPYESFLWKDPIHYAIARQSIGTGDGSTTDFQLIETQGSNNFERYNFKDNTETVWVDSVQQTEGAGNDYTVDHTDSGIISFNAAPGNTLNVEASITEYYRRCHFDAQSSGRGFSYRVKDNGNYDIQLNFFEVVPDGV